METKQNKKCPHCGRGRLVNRVKRQPLVKTFLFWLPLKRYACNVCNKRSYVYGNVWEIADQ